MTERFGGVTAYMRSPATGLWKKDRARSTGTRSSAVEVMVETLDQEYWRLYREELANAFGQQSIVCRAIVIEVL